MPSRADLVTCILLTIATVSPALAQSGGNMANSEATAAGARLFQLRCASCHTDEPGYAPTQEALASRSVEAIVTALTRGPMRDMAAGLTTDQIMAIASYVSSGSAAPPPLLVTGQHAACSERAGTLALTPRDWNGWSRDVGSGRYQPQPGFDAAQVPQLRVKWAFALDGNLHSQPTVVDGRVFVTSAPGRLHSIDADSGCLYWSYQTASGQGGEMAGGGARSTPVVGRIPVVGGPDRGAVYLGDDAATVHAVDAVTGELIWSTRIDDHPIARITGSSVLHEGRLYVPVSSLEEGSAASPAYACCTFRGSVVALDASTGQIVWKTYTIAEAPKAHRTSSSGTQLFGPAGAPIWSTPTVDPERNLLYASTGNSYTEVPQEGSNSILAFDLETGEVRWRKQVREADNFVLGCPQGANCPEDVGPDFDFGSSPILRTLPDGRSVLIVADKGGMAYALDPDAEGAILWSVRVGAGSALGGVQWGPAADDENVYIAVSDYVAPPQERRPGLTALRLDSGGLAWHSPAATPFCSWTGAACSDGLSAAVSLIPGVVFSGSLDGHIRAHSTVDGSVLWDFDTARLYQTVGGGLAEGGSLDAGGATIAGGTLFMTSGYGRFGRKTGNVLLAFTPGGR